MSLLGRFFACCVLCLPATPSNAIEKWTVTDLGSARTEQICVDAATQSLVALSNVFGASRLLKTDWTVFGYGLGGSENDAVITCTYGHAGTTRATLVMYSNNDVQRGLMANRIAQEFYAQAERMEQEWLDEAFERYGY